MRCVDPASDSWRHRARDLEDAPHVGIEAETSVHRREYGHGASRGGHGPALHRGDVRVAAPVLAVREIELEAEHRLGAAQLLADDVEPGTGAAVRTVVPPARSSRSMLVLFEYVISSSMNPVIVKVGVGAVGGEPGA